eukprot:5663295-Alexandrium_andersonii.AAC.1
MTKAERGLVRGGRCRHLRRVRKARRDEDIPMISLSAGRASGRRNRARPRLDLGADGLPGGLLEPVDRRGGPASRPALVRVEPRRGEGAAE